MKNEVRLPENKGRHRGVGGAVGRVCKGHDARRRRVAWPLLRGGGNDPMPSLTVVRNEPPQAEIPGVGSRPARRTRRGRCAACKREAHPDSIDLV